LEIPNAQEQTSEKWKEIPYGKSWKTSGKTLTKTKGDLTSLTSGEQNGNGFWKVPHVKMSFPPKIYL